jgi:hypothetical protein
VESSRQQAEVAGQRDRLRPVDRPQPLEDVRDLTLHRVDHQRAGDRAVGRTLGEPTAVEGKAHTCQTPHDSKSNPPGRAFDASTNTLDPFVGPPNSFTNTQHVRFIGRGPGNDFIVAFTAHVTVNAEDVVTAEHVDFRVDCR